MTVCERTDAILEERGMSRRKLADASGVPLLLSQIKLLCLENGLTLKALEKELRFGNGVIRRWDKSSPSVSAVIKVAKYFNVSMDWLCGLSNAKTKDCEIAAICDYTGLDEDTVSLFLELKQNSRWNDIISHILRIAEIMNKEELS